MVKIICLLALCLTAALGSPIQERIVGGSTVDISRYPYLAGVLFSQSGTSFVQSCGGTIINNRSILTAAHCLSNAARHQIRVGSTFASSGGRVHNVAQVIRHPNYNIHTTNHDIGVIRISGTFTFGNNVRVGSIGSYTIGDNQVVWAAGWGLTSYHGSPSEVLRHVQLWTVNQNSCQNSYGSHRITEYMLCAGPRVANNGVCSRDSGGPLVHNGVVVGVVSFSINCGQPQFPAVFARVSRYVNWIRSNA